MTIVHVCWRDSTRFQDNCIACVANLFPLTAHFLSLNTWKPPTQNDFDGHIFKPYLRSDSRTSFFHADRACLFFTFRQKLCEEEVSQDKLCNFGKVPYPWPIRWCISKTVVIIPTFLSVQHSVKPRKACKVQQKSRELLLTINTRLTHSFQRHLHITLPFDSSFFFLKRSI